VGSFPNLAGGERRKRLRTPPFSQKKKKRNCLGAKIREKEKEGVFPSESADTEWKGERKDQSLRQLALLGKRENAFAE